MKNRLKFQPRHRWSVQERQTLCLFTKLYQNGIQDVTKILNFLYVETFAEEGFDSGIQVATVTAQWAAMRRGSSGSETWSQIGRDITIPEAKKTYPILRQAMEDAALKLQISLCLRSRELETDVAHAFSPDKRRNLQPVKASRSRIIEDSGEGDADEEVSSLEDSDGVLGHVVSSSDELRYATRSPRKKQCIASNAEENSRPTPAPTRKWATSIDQARPIPKLLYRFYNDGSQGLNTPSQFRAGRYVHSQVIPPPTWEIEPIIDHLERRKILTPFISFRETIRACIYLALRADPATNPCVAVVDFSKIGAYSSKERGTQDALKFCPDLIAELDLRLGRDGNYNGSSEWLVHGRVTKDAIVSTFEISEFLHHINIIPFMREILQLKILQSSRNGVFLRYMLMRCHERLGRRSGTAIGLLARALKIPEQFWHEFGWMLAQSWFLGPVNTRTRQRYNDALVRGESGSVEDDSDLGGLEHGESDTIAVLCASGEQSDVGHSGFASTISVEQGVFEEDQCLVDAQIRVELNLSAQGDNVRFGDREETATNSSETDSWVEIPSQASTPSSRFARPRSSSLFTFGQQNAATGSTPVNVSCTLDETDQSTTRSQAVSPPAHSSSGAISAGPWPDQRSVVTKKARVENLVSARPRVVTIDLCAGEEEDVHIKSRTASPSAPAPESEPILLFARHSRHNLLSGRRREDTVDLVILGSRKIGSRSGSLE